MPVPRIDHNTGEPQKLDEIYEWHRGIVDALGDQRTSVLRSIRSASVVAPRFVGMTEDELDDYYDIQRRELDRLTVLNLVASAEATLKIDYYRRVGERLKDPLSRAYRDWHKELSPTKRRRPDFDDDGILDLLKDAHVMDNNIVGRYRECLRVRHWVGHGRYWATPVEVDKLGPEDVYACADELVRALPT